MCKYLHTEFVNEDSSWDFGPNIAAEDWPICAHTEKKVWLVCSQIKEGVIYM